MSLDLMSALLLMVAGALGLSFYKILHAYVARNDSDARLQAICERFESRRSFSVILIAVGALWFLQEVLL